MSNYFESDEFLDSDIFIWEGEVSQMVRNMQNSDGEIDEKNEFESTVVLNLLSWLGSTSRHEAGHFLGLKHYSDVKQYKLFNGIMQKASGENLRTHFLSSDDKSIVQELYAP